MIRHVAINFFKAVERHPYYYFVGLSLILSVWSAYADHVINYDGVLYLSAASHFAEGQWDEAVAIYKWPAYSLLIGSIIRVTALDPYYAAQILNGLLDAATAAIFIVIIRLMGATPRGLIAAGAIIVCHLWVNEMRATIVRDHGYLALYLLATCFFLKDRISPRIRLKLACMAAFLAAAMFRIEGFVFVAAIPVYYGFTLAKTWPRKLLVAGLGVAIVLCLPLATALWRAGFQGHILEVATGEPFAAPGSISDMMLGGVLRRVDMLRGGILTPYMPQYAWIAYLGIVVSITVAGIFKSLTLVYGSMGAFALYAKRVLPNREFVAPLVYLCLINVAFLLVFVFQGLFYDWRFGTALSLTLALPATFTLIEAYRFWWFSSPQNRSRTIFVPTLAIALVIALAIDGLPSPSSHGYIKTAAQWLHTHVTAQQSVISNNKVLMYYAGRWNRHSGPRIGYELDPATEYWTDHAAPASHSFADFDYAVIETRRDGPKIDELIMENLKAQTVITFANNKGERLSIIRMDTD